MLIMGFGDGEHRPSRVHHHTLCRNRRIVQQNPWSLDLCETIPRYNEDDSPAFLNAVHDVCTNSSAGDPVPLVDNQAEPMYHRKSTCKMYLRE